MISDKILMLADAAFYSTDISSPDRISIPDEFCLKFAEMIIFECATVIVAGGRWEGGVVLDKLKDNFNK